MDGWIGPFKRTCAYGSSTCPVVLGCAGLRPVYQPSARRTDSCSQQVASLPYLPYIHMYIYKDVQTDMNIYIYIYI